MSEMCTVLRERLERKLDGEENTWMERVRRRGTGRLTERGAR